MNIVLFDGETYFSRGDARYQHIKKILRKGKSDSFQAGVINGSEGEASITSMDDQGLSFVFTPTRPMRPLHPLIAVIGFPRPIQLKRILRDLASLGVSAVWLTGTELGEKSYRESTLVDRGAAREGLLEGCMQAGGTAVPELRLFDSLEQTLAAADALDAESGTRSFRVSLDVQDALCPLSRAPFGEVSAGRPALLFIGSERGWSTGERALLRAAGCTVCSLGSRILRTETAATAAVAITLSAIGCMEGDK